MSILSLTLIGATGADYTKQAQTVIEARSNERQVVEKVKADNKLAKLMGKDQHKMTKIELDSNKAVKAAKRPAQRMAGITAALGSMTEAYGYRVERQERKAADAKREAREVKRDQQWLQMINKQGTPFKPEDYGLGPKPTAPGSGTTTDTGVESTVTSETAGSGTTPPKVVGGNTSQQITGGPAGKTMSKAQIKALAESVGFNPQAAGIVVGISGGESSFDPSNSTKRSGLFAKTGEDSVGLMQINWGVHKGKPFLTNLGITKREDLLDPVKNMKAAKALYDGRGGGFQDWTVYTSGKYKNYL